MAEGKTAFDVLNFINSYDGCGDSNSLQFFLKNCDAMMAVVRENEKNMLATLIFGTKLTGKAQEVTQYKTFQNWDAIKEFLIEQFTDKRPPTHFLMQIMNIKQNYREKVKNYGDRLKYLYNKYKETCHVNYSDNEAKTLIDNLDSILVSTFRKGLLDEKIQIRVIAESSYDLDKAISIAVDMELENTEKNRYSQGINQIGFLRQNRNYNDRNSQNNTLFCMFCDTNTHLTSECRKLKNYEQSQTNRNRGGGYQNQQYNNIGSNNRNNSRLQSNRRGNIRENNFHTSNNYANPSFSNNNFNHNKYHYHYYQQNNPSQNLFNQNIHRQRFQSNRQCFSNQRNNYNNQQSYLIGKR